MAEASAAVAAAAVQKNYTCEICSRSFARSEHLGRHLRIHTREKPYLCALCPQRFSRADLLRRHEGHCHPETLPNSSKIDGPDGDGATQHGRKKQRTKVACDNCNARKLKCDSERPCKRCFGKNLECTSNISSQRSVRQEVVVREAQSVESRNIRLINDSQSLQSSEQEPIVPSSPTRTLLQPPHEEAPDDEDRRQPPDCDYSQGQSQLPHPGVFLESGAQEHAWHPANYSVVVQTTENQTIAAPPKTSASQETTTRYVHFSPQMPISSEEITTQSAMMDLDLDFASLAQSGQPAYQQNFYNEEGLSNLFPGFNMSFESFPLGNKKDQDSQDLNFDMDDIFDTTFFPLQDIFPNTSPSLEDNVPRNPSNYATSVRVTTSVNNSFDPYTRFRALSDLNMSRPPSPPLLQERNRWISEFGKEDSSAYLMDDKTVIDEFLWLFQDRVSPWFSCFRDAEVKITVDTRKEWYLAMAALGGLYCNTDGSNKIAKWLYHCARQHLFSFVYGKKAEAPTVSDGISVVETYMMLQLFGYLSGDKRLYELTEAIHEQMIQTITDFDLFASNPLINERKRQDLIQSLLVFDCYRVVLIQRPPGLQLFLGAEANPASILSTGIDGSDHLGEYLRAFTQPGSLCDTIQPMSGSYGLLCSLALMTWNVVPPPFSRPNYKKTLWSTSFCELALNEWVSVHDTTPNNSIMLLFHSIHTNMFVCLPSVQNLVVAYISRCSSTKNTSGQSHPVGTLPKVSDLRDIFTEPQNRLKAVWHARQTLELAQILAEDAKRSKCQDIEYGSIKNVYEAESPHFSHCVTFAVLVLWCDSMLSSNLNEEVSSRWPGIGIQVLSDLDGHCVPIKGMFRRILVDVVQCVQRR